MEAGAGASTQHYTPWGEIAEGGNNTLPTEYTYTGQREASATGGIRLLDYGARSYWPFAGRFTAPDTIVPAPGDPQSLNRYAYARNNALRYTDPMGHFEIDQLIEWFGENWRDQFTSAWQAILEEAELGDVLTAGTDDITMFVLNEVGGLAGWHIPTEGLSNAVGIGDWAGTTDASSAALYRSVYAGSGPTHDSSETQGWLEFQHGNNTYQRVGGRYSAAQTLSLPSEWYRGQAQHVQLYTYFAGLDVGLGDVLDLTGSAIATGGAMWLARQAAPKVIAQVGLRALGGVAGVAVLAINLGEWATFDTSYGIASGQGTPLPRPVPEPYH